MDEKLYYYSVWKNLMMTAFWICMSLPFFISFGSSYFAIVVIIVFAFFAISAFWRVCDRRVQMVLDKEGIALRFLEEDTLHWREITHVSVTEVSFGLPFMSLLTLHLKNVERTLEHFDIVTQLRQRGLGMLAGTQPVVVNCLLLDTSASELEKLIRLQHEMRFGR